MVGPLSLSCQFSMTKEDRSDAECGKTLAVCADTPPLSGDALQWNSGFLVDRERALMEL